jgi:flagellar biosynthetic protein FlhB
MAAENKSEKGTAQRHQKATQAGQVPRSRELASSVTLFLVTLATGSIAAGWMVPWRRFFTLALDAGQPEALLSYPILMKTGAAVVLAAGPILWLAFAISTGMFFAQGGFVFAPEAIGFKPERLNPVNNIKRIFSLRGVTPLLRSLLPAAYILWLAVSMLRRDWSAVLHASQLSTLALTRQVMGEALEIAWKSAMVMLVWSGLDYAVQQHDFEEGLKMSKQEVKEEMKDSLGNPTVKGRIRGLQRQMRRKFMMQNIAKATVVVTNPTHYAIALQYTEEMDAPVMLAKGRNLIAEQIKKMARWEGIPMVENKPLAQSLYKTVEVGQTIPPQLYTAVAEILAFIYRAQAMATAAAAAARNSARNPLLGLTNSGATNSRVGGSR